MYYGRTLRKPTYYVHEYCTTTTTYHHHTVTGLLPSDTRTPSSTLDGSSWPRERGGDTTGNYGNGPRERGRKTELVRSPFSSNLSRHQSVGRRFILFSTARGIHICTGRIALCYVLCMAQNNRTVINPYVGEEPRQDQPHSSPCGTG